MTSGLWDMLYWEKQGVSQVSKSIRYDTMMRI